MTGWRGSGARPSRWPRSNHSNIAAIYGIEDSGPVHAIAMEFVDGEDLSQRIVRGALPLDEALPIARQLAEALEAAHDAGIVHPNGRRAHRLMRLPVTSTAPFRIGKPEALFGAARLEVSQYAIARDDRVAVEDPTSRRSRTVLVQNWPALMSGAR